jgi:hypothetical protein
MPIMPRPKKAAVLAFKILGKPANIASKISSRQKRINSFILRDAITYQR